MWISWLEAGLGQSWLVQLSSPAAGQLGFVHMIVAGFQEGKGKHKMPLETSAQNWHNIIAFSIFYQPKHITGLAQIQGVNKETHYFKFYFYLFFTVLGLHCCTQAFCSCGKWGLLSSCGVQASHCSGFSCCKVQALGSWAQLILSMWDLPGPGIKPMSTALSGGFSATGPRGKSKRLITLMEQLKKIFLKSVDTIRAILGLFYFKPIFHNFKCIGICQ